MISIWHRAGPGRNLDRARGNTAVKRRGKLFDAGDRLTGNHRDFPNACLSVDLEIDPGPRA
ncbi:hypothetical protein [Jhaorihella thermophila]|uniref:hypothetical protein n=1 Tax=Jhaorihella thermophila TaxID=488547 RepID=UPI0036132478